MKIQPVAIFGGVVQPGSPNPDPISDKNCHFSHPFSELYSKIHTHYQAQPALRLQQIISSLLRLEQQQKGFFEIHFE